MSSTNRSALFAKINKVLRKHYDPVTPPSERTVLEHLLYACVLENAKHEQVDDVFARLQKNYFDWNEIRVTSVPELAEVMSHVPDAVEAAKRMKRALQSVFETHYVFDIDFLKKQGLGKTIESIEKFSGVTPFVVAYLTQNALAGHSIPISPHALNLLALLGAVSEQDAAKNRVPGLERAIPKNKGVEFASLLHQFTVDYVANPQSAKVKGIVGEIDPAARDKLPKKVAQVPPPPAPPKKHLPRPQLPEQKVDRPEKDRAEKERPQKERPEKDRKADAKKGRSAPAAQEEPKSKVAAARITRKKPK
jgi:endonuclease III